MEFFKQKCALMSFLTFEDESGSRILDLVIFD